MQNFLDLGLSKPVVRVLEQLKFETPTPVQSQAIPPIISGRDVVASAQTGSGKTAAYALPILDCLQESEGYPRALIICPTRELAVQVETQFQLFGEHTNLTALAVYGGTGFDQQIKALKKGVDIIVATPGRLLDHIERGNVNVSNVEILVLDEADRLLDMGFMPQVRRVISKLSTDRQTLMFSATIDDRVEYIASQYLVEPILIRINTGNAQPVEIEQKIFHVHEFDKDALLLRLLRELQMSSVVVFTGTKMRADWVHDRLREADVPCEAIHGDINQVKREKTLQKFRDGNVRVLIATDVAARGLDVPDISHVINYDLPSNPEEYVHRIGRTGRAGRSGVALSFIADDEKHLVREIERVIGRVLDPTQPAVPKVKLPPRRFAARGPSYR